MAKTLEQINQEFFIQWYLDGREPMQEPRWIEPQQIDPVEQWLQELIHDPDLEAADDLLEQAVPTPPRPAPAAFQPAAFQPATEAGRQDLDAAREAGNPKRAIWKSVSNIVFYATLIAIVLSAVIFGGQSGGSSRFFGYQYFEVLTSSMQSVIPQGSLVVTRETPSSQIKVGDIVTFLRSDEETVTHQVVEIVPDFDGRGSLGFRTKGTENPNPDPDIVGAANVIGVVTTHVKNLGFALRWVAGNIKYVFLLFILVILISIALRVLMGDRGKQQVHQPDEGCGHKNIMGGKESRPRERNQELCKRQAKAA